MECINVVAPDPKIVDDEEVFEEVNKTISPWWLRLLKS